MNIILASKQSIILNGILETLSSMNESAIIWSEKNKPAFDMIAEISPDIILIEQQDISKNLLEALQDHKNIIIIIYGVHVPSELSEHKVLLYIPSKTPSIIEKNIDSDILKLRYKDAANVLAFHGGQYNYIYETDIIVINSYDRPPNHMIQQINSVLTTCKYRSKVIGPMYCPTPLFAGATGPQETRDLVASTKVVLDYDFKMTLDLISQKYFVMCNLPNEIVPYFTSDDHLTSQLDLYINQEKLRRKKIRDSYKKIISEHTLFHRVNDIGNILEIKWINDPIATLTRILT